MKAKIIPAALAVLFLSASLFARSRVTDNAGLLSGEEAAGLESLTADIASRYGFDLVIVTERDIGGAEPMAYADDFFDYNGYGLGQDRDGCLFLLVTGSRDYWFSTSGQRGKKILNSSGALNKLESSVVGRLRDGDMAGAFRAFTGNWEEFLALAAKGRNYNFFYEWNAVLVICAWVLALVIACLIVASWKRKMNTVLLPRKEADSYLVSGSLAFTQQQERFLYSTVTRAPRPKSSSSSFSGGRGGGGGSHTSSSGRSHGGGGGKY